MHFSCKRSNFSFECLPIWNVYITTLLLIKLRFDFAGLSQMIVVMGKENSSLRIIGFSKSRKYFFMLNVVKCWSLSAGNEFTCQVCIIWVWSRLPISFQWKIGLKIQQWYLIITFKLLMTLAWIICCWLYATFLV